MYHVNTLHSQEIFNKLDKNGDGFVSIDELMWLLQKIGVHTNRDELELLVGGKALDPLDFHFFYQTLMTDSDREQVKRKDQVLERDVRKAFRVFDLNDDGFISCEELQIALARLGLWDGGDCKEMIRVYDTNSDGLLDFDEFKVMLFFDSLESS